MIKKILLLFSVSLFSVASFATPEKLEVIFLSHSYVNQIHELLKPKFRFYKHNVVIAMEEAKKNCVPMGDGCFHPQYGFIEDETKEKPIEKPKKVELKTINALETNLVECRDGNYFDIFCGKAQKIAESAPIQIWVDISSSMKNVDSNINSPTCYRKTFINNILDQCPKNSVDVSVYNNVLKLMGSSETLCLSYGMNSPNRFKEWIEASKSKHLFVITDIDEMNQEMAQFLEKHGAKIKGVGAKDFSAKNLDEYAKEFIKTCQKK